MPIILREWQFSGKKKQERLVGGIAVIESGPPPKAAWEPKSIARNGCATREVAVPQAEERMGRLRAAIIGPKSTFLIRYVLDEWVPPALRDQRWFYLPILKLYNDKLDPDFKVKAPGMSAEEFTEAYEKLMPMRQTDVTPRVAEFVRGQLTGKTVLELGCGNGDISLGCAQRGYAVMATDLVEGNLERLAKRASEQGVVLETKMADVEQLPFAEGAFDTVVCLHTLEHVRNLPKAVEELRRVTGKRLIVVVPRERYYRYTCNYHLNFFGGTEQLELLLGMKSVASEMVDGAICYAGEK